MALASLLNEFEDNKSFCHTCLSTGRILTPITEYKSLCEILFNSFELMCSLENMYLCWECSALMKNLIKFLQKVEKVQQVLLDVCYKKKMECLKSLSTFTTNLITDYQIINYDDKYLPNPEEIFTHPYEEKYKIDTNPNSVDVIIKEEINDDILSQDIIDNDILLEEVNDDKVLLEEDIDDDLKLEEQNNVGKMENDIEQNGCEEQININRTKTQKASTGYKEQNNVGKMENDIEQNGCEEQININRTKTQKASTGYKEQNYVGKMENDIEQNGCEEQININRSKTQKASTGYKEQNNVGKMENDIEQNGCEEQININRSKTQKASTGYKIIEGYKCRENYKRFDIKREDLEFWFKQIREHPLYVNSKQKCQSCILGFSSKKRFENHMKTYHAKTAGRHICDTCKIRFLNRKSMVNHWRTHLVLYECSICLYRSHNYSVINKHFTELHSRAIVCLNCDAKFEYIKEFYRHYSNLHCNYICDYCCKITKRKELLLKHILTHHTTYRCEPCNKTFKNKVTYISHNQHKHTCHRTEAAYCVECDLQFANELLYRRHVMCSVKHTAHNKERALEQVPCPECDKTYSRKTFMMNHYRYVHLKKSKHYCQACDKYFLTATRHREHRERVHENKPKSLKYICNICSRAFNTRRILENHVRTHTGERPNACPHCPARFVQKYAMQTHVRNIHRMLII